MRKRLPWIVFAVLVTCSIIAYWRYTATHKPPPVEYKTATIEHRRIVGRVTASGTLQATVTVQVGTQVSGRIQKLFADFNSPVKKGEIVAKIDPQLFQAAVAQAHANYASAAAGVVKAEAQVRDAQLQYGRVKALFDQQLASGADLQSADTNLAVAKASVDVAKASLEQARASLNQAQVNLDYTTIYSPIDGVVISRSVDVGQTVAASLQAPTLFTIAEDLKKMQVNTNVAEGDVGRLKEGMKSYFTVDAFPGQRFYGTISTIRNAAQTVQNVVTYDAVIDVDNSDLRLRPGMTANVTVVYDEKNDVPAIPNAALRFRPPPEVGGAASNGASASASAPRPRASARAKDDASDGARTVWLLRGDHAEQASIHTGLSDGTYTQIVDGDVHDGDQVVTDAIVANKGSSGGGAAPGGGMRRMF
jgi:HlyD family secretion protein